MGEYVKKPLLAKKCEICNAEFTTKQEKKKLCSINCYAKHSRDKNRTSQKKKCKNCDKDFIANRVDKLFCSKDCQWNYRYKTKRKKLVEIKCKQCGEEFVRKHAQNKYCSTKCRNKSKTCQGYVHTVRRQDGTYVSKHRYVIEQHIERKLTFEETVHHKDLNKENNNLENLYLFKNRTDHGLCHGSLNKLVENLLKKDIIQFDENTGNYKFSEKI